MEKMPLSYWIREFFVPGVCKPKGSMVPLVSASTGRAIVIEQKKAASKSWQKAVSVAAKQHAPSWSLNGAIHLHLVFHMAKPATVKRKTPSVRPDVDKLCRSVLDALTRARIYDDDGQVIALDAEKKYSDTPGVNIKIVALEPQPFVE